MRALVTGATGYIGSRLVTTLLDAGHDVVVAGRDLEKLARYGWIDRVQAIMFDAADAEGVAAALRVAAPIDVLYYLIYDVGQGEAENRVAALVAKAAADSGVGRIVHLGGFAPHDETASEHLLGRAEVTAALQLPGGPPLVWLGAAMIIGAGSTSFEMLRYTADRFVLMPMPRWARHPVDPISIQDVLYYLLAAADRDRVQPGTYDLCGPRTTTYGELMHSYARLAGAWRARLAVRGLDAEAVYRVTGMALPIPGPLAADLVASLDRPMTASDARLSKVVCDPPGGLVDIDDAIGRALVAPAPKPVDQLDDPHHLADTDAAWAGGDALRIQRLAAAVTPPFARPALGWLSALPKPVAGAVRAGLDAVVERIPKPGSS